MVFLLNLSVTVIRVVVFVARHVPHSVFRRDLRQSDNEIDTDRMERDAGSDNRFQFAQNLLTVWLVYLTGRIMG